MPVFPLKATIEQAFRQTNIVCSKLEGYKLPKIPTRDELNKLKESVTLVETKVLAPLRTLSEFDNDVEGLVIALESNIAKCHDLYNDWITFLKSYGNGTKLNKDTYESQSELDKVNDVLTKFIQGKIDNDKAIYDLINVTQVQQPSGDMKILFDLLEKAQKNGVFSATQTRLIENAKIKLLRDPCNAAAMNYLLEVLRNPSDNKSFNSKYDILSAKRLLKMDQIGSFVKCAAMESLHVDLEAEVETIDDVNLKEVSGHPKVLLVGQDNRCENGIYIYNNGKLIKYTEFPNKTGVLICGGLIFRNTKWVLTQGDVLKIVSGSTQRVPNGTVSSTVCQFFKWPNGTSMRFLHLVQYFTDYLEFNGLSTRGRGYTFDEAMTTLLGSQTRPIAYCELKKLIKKHWSVRSKIKLYQVKDTEEVAKVTDDTIKKINEEAKDITEEVAKEIKDTTEQITDEATKETEETTEEEPSKDVEDEVVSVAGDEDWIAY